MYFSVMSNLCEIHCKCTCLIVDYKFSAMKLKLSEDNVAFVYEHSASDTSFSSENSDVNDGNVYPVMLVTHLGVHVKHKQADISLENVIDHKSDLSLNFSVPKEEIKMLRHHATFRNT